MTPAPEQPEPYYSMHRGFVNRYRARRARALGVPALTFAAWYAVMHDIASNAGTFGVFTTDVRAFMEALGEPPRYGVGEHDRALDADLAATWRKLEAAKVVEIIEGAPEGVEDVIGLPVEFRVRVLGLADVNRPRKAPMSDAERQAKARERRRERGADQAPAARHESHEASRSVTDSHETSRAFVTSRGTNQPTNQPTNHQDASRVPASAPAREASQPPDEVTKVENGKGRQAQHEITKARRILGSLDIAAQDLIALADDERRERGRKTLNVFEQLRLYWSPLAELHGAHGEPALRYALVETLRAGKPSVQYVATCCDTYHREKRSATRSNDGPPLSEVDAQTMAQFPKRILASRIELADACLVVA